MTSSLCQSCRGRSTAIADPVNRLRDRAGDPVGPRPAKPRLRRGGKQIAVSPPPPARKRLDLLAVSGVYLCALGQGDVTEARKVLRRLARRMGAARRSP